MKHIFTLLFFLGLTGIDYLFSQANVIKLKNPSFEGVDAAGDDAYFKLAHWTDCARHIFPNETSPDIHSASSEHFDVRHMAFEGSTFLGMVTREIRETYEMVSQQLDSPLKANRCYKFNIYLAKSANYYSNVETNTSVENKKNFNNPVKLRIWGCLSGCSKTQLLAESPLVNHNDWRQYNFKFKPTRDYKYIMFEAFYKTPVLVPYNGNILLDKASDIVEIPCPDKSEIAKVDVKKPPPPLVQKKNEAIKKSTQPAIKKPSPILSDKKNNDSSYTKIKKSNKPEQKNRILKQLEKDKIMVGQIIRIEQLLFDADSSNIKEGSFEVLNEIYTFLDDNPNVIIEIGGHTNGIPEEKYCNALSTERAKKVAEHLYKKGIPTYRIKYYGYGKLKPIASDKTPEGRKRNQRVEIKILYTGN